MRFSRETIKSGCGCAIVRCQLFPAMQLVSVTAAVGVIEGVARERKVISGKF
jgi:hypothetical protein